MSNVSPANIQVVARFRPQNARELAENGRMCVAFGSDSKSVTLTGPDGQVHNFTFDRVFPCESTQAEVYQYAALNIVQDVLKGYNGTVFAYGQTCSGKTHTMEGPNVDDDQMMGIVPRIVRTIFDGVMDAPEHLEFTIKVSMIEIYMERIRDLLDVSRENLQIHDSDKDKGIWIGDCTEIFVGCAEEVLQVMKLGGQNRKIAATKMNPDSSRSHSIFIISLIQKNTQDGSAVTGKLFLVDLAGSEKVKKTGADGQQLAEAKTINKSLSALGKVINALTDGKSTHVPYRDSKVTRVLQDSLGGNSRTSLIICNSPSTFNHSETLSTLRFGLRAKSIRNKARINQERSAQELKVLLAKAEATIQQLRDYIAGLEDELSLYKASGAVPAAAGSVAAGDSEGRSNLPNVARLQDKIVQLEGQAKEVEDEKINLQLLQDALLDQLQEKTFELEAAQEQVAQYKRELNQTRAQDASVHKENELLIQKLADLTFNYEKVQYDLQENGMTLETLQSQNQSLREEKAMLQKNLDTHMQSGMNINTAGGAAAASNPVGPSSKVQAARSNWQDVQDTCDKQEEQLRTNLRELNQLDERINNPEQAALSEKDKEEKDSRERELSSKIADLEKELESTKKRNNELENDVQTVNQENDCLKQRVDKLLTQKEEELKKEEAQFKERESDLVNTLSLSLEEKANLSGEINGLVQRISSQNEDILKLKAIREDMELQMASQAVTHEKKIAFMQQCEKDYEKQKEESQVRHKQLEEDMRKMKDQLTRQMNEFEALKASLLHDLKDRCEKVIDLEMSLDEAKEQYNELLKTSSSSQLKKKVLFLNRNLEQLTLVYQQLVSQNSALRVENQVADRRIARKNERIKNLELLLQESRDNVEKLNNHQFALEAERDSYKKLIMPNPSNSDEGRGSISLQTSSPFNNLGARRIAKPIRGGGGKTPAIVGGGGRARSGSGEGVN
eukprot:gnl/Hemi2/20904_TR6928_c0_g1_i1.p1 gnl/Hemi2/20904_TR6928_c0_g1~~gnl/Hemi2/20904_TR6928_c0_g1_i1.p1  ORF type:complete len:959 (-),score=429.06 gnl/Hemi2/20904_TR6928_c0_g1_i1:260-3136(-)